MNKIVSTKTTSTIFLAIVLVTGTIAAISPYFLTVTAEAQSYYYDGMDNSYYKSQKDSSKSVLINKLKCLNNNININGNNTGDINIGNKGQGYLGVSSSDGIGYDGSEGYSKQGKGFDCVINNNNNNINIITDGGNVTDGNVTEPQTCEECFEQFLTEGQLSTLLGSASLEQYCDFIESGGYTEAEFRVELENVDVPTTNIDALIACLENLGIEFD